MSAGADAGGAGQAGDAVSAFEAQIVDAARRAVREPAADPRVPAAVQLGWVMGSVLNGRTDSPLPAGFPLHDSATVLAAKGIEISVLLTRLSVTPDERGKAVTDSLAAGQIATHQAADWQPGLVASLFGADVRLAKAYGVGYTLDGLAHEPGPTPALFRREEIVGMLAALDDLSTTLPAHAARGVANSVRRWQGTYPTGENPRFPAPTLAMLQAQCELWRTVLTGEKRATELLEPENYLDAGERLAVKLRASATVVVKQHAPIVALAVVLFAAAVLVLLIAPSSGSDAVAGLSGVLVAVGITWKGIGASVGALAGKVEGPLWGAELDGAVTDAITLLVEPPPSPRTPRDRLLDRGDTVREVRLAAPTGDYAGRAQRRPGVDPGETADPGGTAATRVR